MSQVEVLIKTGRELMAENEGPASLNKTNESIEIFSGLYVRSDMLSGTSRTGLR